MSIFSAAATTNGDDALASSVSSSSSSNVDDRVYFAFLLDFSDTLVAELRQQAKRHTAAMVRSLQSKASFLLGQREEALAKANKVGLELELRLKSAEEDRARWQIVAMEKEAIAIALHNTLEQVREPCLSTTNGVPTEEAAAPEATAGMSSTTLGRCRVCGHRDAEAAWKCSGNDGKERGEGTGRWSDGEQQKRQQRMNRTKTETVFFDTLLNLLCFDVGEEMWVESFVYGSRKALLELEGGSVAWGMPKSFFSRRSQTPAIGVFRIDMSSYVPRSRQLLPHLTLSLFPLLCSQITCSRLCQSRWFHGTLRVKRLPDFEDRPCGSKSMPCSIEALVCDFSSLVTVPAMLVLKNKLKYN
ncbi:hypothetical protein BHM03_00050683 [Ensete ventricosum]|nr:hypothetical protein BHM03_00050683 [Ensete ventricosum]